MKIGIRLHDAEGQSLEEKLKNAREMGFSCVHLALSKVIGDFSMKDAPGLLTEALADEVRGLLSKYQMEAAVLGCYLNLATPDGEELKWTQACYGAHLRFAAQIGARVVGTETGATNTAYRFTPPCHTQEALQLFIRRLRPLVEEAGKAGVPIAIEPVAQHIVSTPQRARAVLDALDSPFVKIILDPVNLLDMENCVRQKAVFGEALTLLSQDIAVVHWKDYVKRDGELTAVAGGEGEMQADEVLAFLSARPNIPITLENTTPQNAQAAALRLRQQIENRMG